MAGVEETHQWVAISYVPIEVEPQPDGSLDSYTREGQEDLARDDSMLACWHCFTELTPESYTTPCRGAQQGS